MIQLRSILKVADNTGIKKLRVIRVLGGSKRRFGSLGDVVVASVYEAIPGSTFEKGDVVRAVIVRTRKEVHRRDGSWIRFDDNAAVVIDKQGNPKGTRILGPVAREVKQKGFSKLAAMAPELV